MNEAWICGLEKRERGSVHRVQCGEVPNLGNSCDEDGGDRKLCGEAHHIGRQHDRFPREPVCDHTADQQEHQQGNRPRREHDSNRGLRASDLEHRKGHRDPKDSVANDRNGLAGVEQAEIPVSQHRCSRRGHLAKSTRSSNSISVGVLGKMPRDDDTH